MKKELCHRGCGRPVHRGSCRRLSVPKQNGTDAEASIQGSIAKCLESLEVNAATKPHEKLALRVAEKLVSTSKRAVLSRVIEEALKGDFLAAA